MNAPRSLASMALSILFLACFAIWVPSSLQHATASTPALSLVVPDGERPAAGLISVQLVASNAVDLTAWEFDLAYDPALVQLVDVEPAPSFGAGGSCDPGQQHCVLTLGPQQRGDRWAVGAVSYGTDTAFDGNGAIATLRLRPTGIEGSTFLRLHDPLIVAGDGRPRTPVVHEARLVLGGGHSLFLPSVSIQDETGRTNAQPLDQPSRHYLPAVGK